MVKMLGVVVAIVGLVFSKWVYGFEFEGNGSWVHGLDDLNVTEVSFSDSYGVSSATTTTPILVGLTLIQGADAKGAGTLFSDSSLHIFAAYSDL